MRLEDVSGYYYEGIGPSAHLEEKKTASLGVGATSGSSDTVNVVFGVVRGIELHNEIDSRNL